MSANLSLITPAQGSPSVANNWAAAVINPNMSTIDAAITNGLTKSVAGSVNIVLVESDAVNSSFVLTGAITANIVVLFPQSKAFNFSIQNQTTGAFTLSVGSNNGSGVAAGGTVVVPQDGTCQTYRVDGTNAFARGGASFSIPLPVASGGTGAITAAAALTSLGIGNFANTGSTARNLTIQSGGGPSGGNDGDFFFIF